jgi:hypothetical protein
MKDFLRGWVMVYRAVDAWILVMSRKRSLMASRGAFWEQVNDYKDDYPCSPWDKYQQEIWDATYEISD